MDGEVNYGESSAGYGPQEPWSPSFLKRFMASIETDDVDEHFKEFMSKGEDPHDWIEDQVIEEREVDWSEYGEFKVEACEAVKDSGKKLKDSADESDTDKVVRDLCEEFRTETSKIRTSNEFVLEFEDAAQPESPGSDLSQPTFSRLASSLLKAAPPDDHEADDPLQLPGSKPDSHLQLQPWEEFLPEQVTQPESKESDRPQPISTDRELPSSLLKNPAPDDHELYETTPTPAAKPVLPESERSSWSSAKIPRPASSSTSSDGSKKSSEPTFSWIEVPDGKGTMIVRSSLSELGHTSGPIPMETLRAIAAHYSTLGGPQRPPPGQPSKRQEKKEKWAKKMEDFKRMNETKEAHIVNEPSINQTHEKEPEPSIHQQRVNEPEPPANEAGGPESAMIQQPDHKSEDEPTILQQVEPAREPESTRIQQPVEEPECTFIQQPVDEPDCALVQQPVDEPECTLVQQPVESDEPESSMNQPSISSYRQQSGNYSESRNPQLDVSSSKASQGRVWPSRGLAEIVEFPDGLRNGKDLYDNSSWEPGDKIPGFRVLEGDIIIHRARHPPTEYNPGGFISIYRGDFSYPHHQGQKEEKFMTHIFLNGEIVVRMGHMTQKDENNRRAWKWHKELEVFVHKTDRNPGVWLLASRTTMQALDPPMVTYDPRYYILSSSVYLECLPSDLIIRTSADNSWEATFYGKGAFIGPGDMLLRASYSMLHDSVLAIAELFWRDPPDQNWTFQGRHMYTIGGSVMNQHMGRYLGEFGPVIPSAGMSLWRNPVVRLPTD